MYIESVPNRNSPPAILLRESYRQDGKVRKRTLCNLSDWPQAHIEGLRGVLKGGVVIPAERDAFTVTRTLPHGHVAAALGTARKIGLERILGPDRVVLHELRTPGNVFLLAFVYHNQTIRNSDRRSRTSRWYGTPSGHNPRHRSDHCVPDRSDGRRHRCVQNCTAFRGLARLGAE